MTGKSLAQFIFDAREQIGLSQSGLAKKSNIPINLIEDIESGKELFLSSTIRQKLAKGLKMNPSEIKPYEKDLQSDFDTDEEYAESIRKSILDGETQGLTCPICYSPLQTRIVKMYDLEDNLVLHPKANCVKCPFQIK